MSIIDTFPYFNEKELLELRIKLLSDYVDKFIIVDANKTHKGDQKPFTCKETLEKLNLLDDKIFVIELDLPSYEEEPNAWVRERMQRNAAAKFITENDVAIVSDCDEIIDPKYIEYYIDVAKKHPNNILRIPMVLLNCRADLIVCDENNNEIICASPFFCLKYHLNKYTLSDIRESHAIGTNHIKYKGIFTTENNIIDKAGWHFSWMGDYKKLKQKHESFLHWNETDLIENYRPTENSYDILGRKNHILKNYSINNLPQKIFDLPNVAKFLGLTNKTDSTQKTLIQILEEQPFLMTDKNTVQYKKYNDTYPWMQHHSYIEHFYEDAFKEYQNRSNVKVCEIGIDVGGSISLLSKYFINGHIFGIDIHADRLSEDNQQNKFNNVTYLIHDAYSSTFIDSLPMFDIIIDDGPHTFDSMIIFVEYYINKLNDGGLMVIEDIPDYEWIQYLKYFLPSNVKTDIIDLRHIDNVQDSLLLCIKK